MVSTLSSKPERGGTASAWQAWLTLCLFALLVRGGGLLLLYDSLQQDTDAYRQIAENVLRHQTYGLPGATGIRPSAFRPPLYPLLLAACSWPATTVALWKVAVLHVALGVATVLLTALLAQQWQLPRGRWLAAGLVALDPILLNQSGTLMTETVATFMAVLLLLVLSRWSARQTPAAAVAAGVAMGLAILCRPTFLALLLVAMVLAVARFALRTMFARVRRNSLQQTGGPQTSRARSLALVGLFAISAALTVAPWAYRNDRVLGQWKFTTTHGGYTLLLANNRLFYQHLRAEPWGTIWSADQFDAGWNRRALSDDPHYDFWSVEAEDAAAGLAADQRIRRDEFADDAFAYRMAQVTMRRQPTMFLYSCLVRAARLWTPLAHEQPGESSLRAAARWCVAAWYIVLLILAAAALATNFRSWFSSPRVWGLLLCASFTAVHAIYWSNMRMRAPLMPVIALLATEVILRIVRRP